MTYGIGPRKREKTTTELFYQVPPAVTQYLGSAEDASRRLSMVGGGRKVVPERWRGVCK